MKKLISTKQNVLRICPKAALLLLVLFFNNCNYNNQNYVNPNIDKSGNESKRKNKVIKYVERPISDSTINQFVNNIEDDSVILAPISINDKREPQFMSFVYPATKEIIWLIPSVYQNEVEYILASIINDDSPIVRLVPLKDKDNYQLVCSKYSPVFGGKKAYRRCDCWDVLDEGKKEKPIAKQTLDCFFQNKKYENYISVADKGRIKDAMDIEAQTENWTCGPNSSFRAITILCGKQTKLTYAEWKRCCPKYVDRETTVEKSTNVAEAGFFTTMLGIIGTPFTGGASLALVGVGAPVFIGGVISAEIASGVECCDVGPSPNDLNDYLNRNFCKDHYAEFIKCRTYSYCSSIIKESIMKGFPVLCLFISSVLDMHYATVVGIELDEKEGIKNYVLLNTCQRLFHMTASNFEYCLRNSVPGITEFLASITKGYDLGNYNIITLIGDKPQTRYTHKVYKTYYPSYGK